MPEAEIGTDEYGEDLGPQEGLAFDTDAEETEEMGSPARGAKRINAWMRQIAGVMDMTLAKRIKDKDGVSEHVVLAGWRNAWKNEWCDLTVKNNVVGRHHFQTIPGGILNLIPEEAGVNDNTVTLEFADPIGGVRPVDVSPYWDKGLTEPIQVQLLHCLKSRAGSDDPHGLDLDRVVVRAVHAPQYFEYDPATEVGLKLERVEVSTGLVKKYEYALVDYQRIEHESGSFQTEAVPVAMYNPATGKEQPSTFDKQLADQSLRFKLANQYRWVAALKIADIECDGNNTNVEQWMFDGRRLIYGEQGAAQQEADAAERIANSGTRSQQYTDAANDF